MNFIRMLALLAGLVTSSAYAVTCPTFAAGDTNYISKLNQLSAGCAPIGGGAPGSPLTTKGDLWTYTTGDARLAVGTSGYILSANSGTTTGLEWIAVPSVSLTATYIGYGNGSNALTGASTLTYAFGMVTNATSDAGPVGFTAQNTNSAGSGMVAAGNSGGDAIGLYKYGSTNGGVGVAGSGDNHVLTSSGKTVFSNVAATDYIFTRGGYTSTTEVMRLGAGTLSLGVAGTTVGAVKFNNATSGSITVQPPTGALGTVTLTLPSTTGTLALTGGGASLTATYVGYGDGSNALTGEAAFNYDATTNTLTADNIADSRGDVRLIPQNSRSAAYTFAASDCGKHVFHPDADTTARTFTIDSNANLALSLGCAITIVNGSGSGVITLAITSDTLRFGAATGSRSIAANCVVTLIKVVSTVWYVTGGSCLT